MTTYRTKQTFIQAFQVPPEGETCSDEMIDFLTHPKLDIDNFGDGSIHIIMNGGKALICKPSDWVFTIDGDLFGCINDKDFKTHYELHVPTQKDLSDE